MFGCIVGCGAPAEKATGFAAEIEGTTVTCDVDVMPYIHTFGDGYTYSEAISCAYDGLDKIYMYPDFSLYTYPQGERDFVAEIELLTNRYATSNGIRIGSLREDVLNTYGETYTEEGILQVYFSNETDNSAYVSIAYDDDGRVMYLSIESQVVRETEE